MDSTQDHVNENVPEMARSLKQMIDNNLEEAEFEKGIAMLEQLRSPNHVPSIAHILHLIYIALHPVKDIQLNTTGPDDEDVYDPKALLQASPRKLVKQTKSRRVLTADAVMASQRLLSALIRTNAANSLAPALPCYPDVTLESPFEIELVDSVIFLQVKALRSNSKSCWDFVKTGALEQAKRAYPTSGKSKGRGSASRGSVGYSSNDTLESDEIKPVGENSWFLLGWLMDLFEKDAEDSVLKGQPRHSPLLLQQIPRAAHGSSTRWDCSEPLKIILYAFQQTQSRRQNIGRRLLMLLIDLTQLLPAPLLSMQGLMTSIIARFSSSSSLNSLAPSILPKIMSQLPLVPSVLAFRLALCKRILQDALMSDSSLSPSATRAGPKPRALPRKSTTLTSVTEASSAPETTPAANTGLSLATPQMPSYEETAQLIRKQIPSRMKKTDITLKSGSFLFRIKFEMLLACGTLRRLLSTASNDSHRQSQLNIDVDRQWTDALRGQEILGLLDAAFGGPLPENVEEAERSLYLNTLKSFYVALT
ncbi:hypothetical protein CVT24_004560 [Panaeolus cyanescens]|uniref:Uncharacterized protein n=1 Tax=Panaeolus cyanescens TaxID=181874 RepID=A0A409VDB0_9AGAR|nr:hypothetical protein CVT24_004560 [Panaeolus cyanescens]